jgi:DNA cross-link repair 1A protein
VENVVVTFYDANHCPGAVTIVFELPDGKSYFHSGDFRFDLSKFTKYSTLKKYLSTGFDRVYLDTTFCHPDYAFTSQSDAIETLVRSISLKLRQQPKTLVLVGTYTIGKERILEALAKECNIKIHANEEKYDILSKLELPYFDIFTSDPNESNVHLVGMFDIQWGMLESLKKANGTKYKEILGVKPTGWSRNKTSNTLNMQTKREFSIIECPYSEHSSFDELREFVSMFNPKLIIPTVTVDEVDNMRHYLTTYDHKKRDNRLKIPKSLTDRINTLDDYRKGSPLTPVKHQVEEMQIVEIKVVDRTLIDLTNADVDSASDSSPLVEKKRKVEIGFDKRKKNFPIQKNTLDSFFKKK